MRPTVVLHRQNLGHLFRVFWVAGGRRRIQDLGTAKTLEARGIQVVDPNDILSAPYPRPKRVELPPNLPDMSGVVRGWTADKTKTRSRVPHQPHPCSLFTNHFTPIMGVPQAQLLTNTLVQPSLPQAVLERATPTTPEEDHRIQQAIMNAHLLDSSQIKLARMDPPGRVYKREYGIPLSRANKSLTYQLLLLLDQMCEGDATNRTLVEDTISCVTLNHSDRLMQFRHRAGFIISGDKPLPRVADSSGVEEMPDLYPISPFISVKPPTHYYDMQDQYGVCTSRQAPHTVVIHNNSPKLQAREDNFIAMSLLFSFSHAAAYAKVLGKSEEELREDPVVVQIIHCCRQQYHMGVFQLNTFNLTSPHVHNMFWTQPWDFLFASCSFKGAAPVLEGYNSKVFSLLKGLHVQGMDSGKTTVREAVGQM